MLSDRYKDVLNEITSNPAITSMKLESQFNLTRRQLGYRIEKINEWLMFMELPLIERTRQGQFVIDPTIIAEFRVNHSAMKHPSKFPAMTEDQRGKLILLMLVSAEEELSLNHFVFELGVSKNTILSDLKQSQRFLTPYHLTIRYSRKYGYQLEGDEFQVRKLLMDITALVLEMNNGEEKLRDIAKIHKEHVKDFVRRIEKAEESLTIKYTDEKMKAMPYIFILNIRRVEQGNTLKPFSIEYKELSDTKEYRATEGIFYDEEEVIETERLFITLHLLSTNVISSEVSNDVSLPDLVPAIDSMLRQFEKNACIYLQDRPQLIEKLLQHIKPAYYRVKYHLTGTAAFDVPLSKEFQEITHLVKRASGPLSHLIGSEIPEKEISFIAMLIGGWMRRQGESIEKKVKAIVVCPQGVSVSRLMFNELNELFPEFIFLDYLSVREFLQYPLDYEVVFSPVSLETTKKLFVTKTFLGHEEKLQFRNRVMLAVHSYIPSQIDMKNLTDLIKKHATVHDESALAVELESFFKQEELLPVKNGHRSSSDINLDQLIRPETITLRDTVATWEEAVRLSAEPLLQCDVITKGYIDSMIQYCEKDSYIVISPNLAIPHAAPEDGANKVGMSLLRIKHGVQYAGEHTIHLIITIAAVDKKQHIHSLMQLMKLASSEEDRKRLVQAESVEEIYEVIRLYSKD